MENRKWVDEYYVYDVEIAKEVDEVPGKWDNPEGMGFSSGVVYSKAEDRYYFFVGRARLGEMLKLLNKRHVVSFNGVKFDSRVVLGNQRVWFPATGTVAVNDIAWFNFDILLEFVRRHFRLADVGQAEAKLGERTIHDGSFGLDALCKATFGKAKTGHGAKAPLLYKAGQIDELLEYNYNDVKITRDLYEFILQYGYVVDGHGEKTAIPSLASRGSVW